MTLHVLLYACRWKNFVHSRLPSSCASIPYLFQYTQNIDLLHRRIVADIDIFDPLHGLMQIADESRQRLKNPYFPSQ